MVEHKLDRDLSSADMGRGVAVFGIQSTVLGEVASKALPKCLIIIDSSVLAAFSECCT